MEKLDGCSINNSDESQRNGKTNGRFFSGFGANATLTGNHGAASTKLQLRLEFKGVCQVEDSIFLHVFSCLRQTQHKSPKSGRPAVILQVKMTESLYLKIKREKQEEDELLMTTPFRTEITPRNCCLVQKVCSKYIRQVSQS